jgi:hypothetical protein
MTVYRADLMRKELPSAPMFLFDYIEDDTMLPEETYTTEELFSLYENQWCPQNLSFQGVKVYGKMLKKDFQENIVIVFHFHHLRDTTAPHDFPIWYEDDMDNSGAVPEKTHRFTFPYEQRAQMRSTFRDIYGFLEPVDVEE